MSERIVTPVLDFVDNFSTNRTTTTKLKITTKWKTTTRLKITTKWKTTTRLKTTIDKTIFIENSSLTQTKQS